MSASYRGQVAIAFEVLADGLAPFVDDRMTKAFPDEDWILMAATKLGKRRDVLVSLSDPHFQLEVLNRWWGPAFAGSMHEDVRSAVGELRTARNHWAHPDPDHPFDLDYALRVHLLVEDELRSQLDDARAQARSATGRSRAVARQLAELQSQYAAVAGLRDQYEELQRQLEDERRNRERVSEDTTAVRDQLSAAEAALAALRRESDLLRDQLSDAREAVHKI